MCSKNHQATSNEQGNRYGNWKRAKLPGNEETSR